MTLFHSPYDLEAMEYNGKFVKLAAKLKDEYNHTQFARVDMSLFENIFMSRKFHVGTLPKLEFIRLTKKGEVGGIITIFAHKIKHIISTYLFCLFLKNPHSIL